MTSETTDAAIPGPTDAGDDLSGASPPSLGRRFASGRTALSLLFAFALLAFFLYRQGPETLADAWEQVRSANPWLCLAAFACYYTAFPIRGLRWRILLQNSGEPPERVPRVRDLAEIIYLSWFANSIVPAKLGDVYRGWLLRRTSGISWSHAMGTIVAERVLDLIVLVSLMVVTGLIAYGDVLGEAMSGGPLACLESGIHPEAISCTLLQVFVAGGLLAGILVLALAVFARFGTHVERVLPRRLGAIYVRFANALVLSFGRFGPLMALSVLGWLAEGGSFFLVGLALGYRLPLPLVVFIAFLQAFVTALAVTPGGLGFAEIILPAALQLRGFPADAALAMTGLYRAITWLSLVIGGLVVYLVSKKTK